MSDSRFGECSCFLRQGVTILRGRNFGGQPSPREVQNIARCIDIPIVESATGRANPFPDREGEIRNNVSTSGTRFR
jgi:hypothetical protein